MDERVDLRTPLSIRSSFAFPLQTRQSRTEILIGALWLLVPGVGWLMNMGHRIVMVHHMMNGRSAWPAWKEPLVLLKHGAITFAGMLYYYLPAGIALWFAVKLGSAGLGIAGFSLLLIATVAIPGYMSHYCLKFDMKEIFNPAKALSRCFQGGRLYWHAWLIALSSLAVSFLGLGLVGVGFLISSVWFWQVAGFSFASVFSQRFSLSAETA